MNSTRLYLDRSTLTTQGAISERNNYSNSQYKHTLDNHCRIDTMLTYILLFLGTVYHCIKWQVQYRIKHKHEAVQFLSLLIVGFASTLLLLAYMAYEDGGIRIRTLLGAIVSGIVIDIARNEYPSVGCATYMTALAFFITMHDLREVHEVYFYLAGLIMFASIFLFSLEKPKMS